MALKLVLFFRPMLWLLLGMLMKTTTSSQDMMNITNQLIKNQALFNWDSDDELVLQSLPPLVGNYFTSISKPSNNDGISFIRVKKTGSKSTVQLIASGWLWGDIAPIISLKKKPMESSKRGSSTGFLPLCNKSNCNDINKYNETLTNGFLKVKLRECMMEGHCTSGFETKLNDFYHSHTSSIRILRITNIRNPIARILSEFRHYCGEKYLSCQAKRIVKSTVGSQKSLYICPTTSPYCDIRHSSRVSTNWDIFLDYVTRQSNSFSRSLMTQVLGLSTNKNIELNKGAVCNEKDNIKRVIFPYNNSEIYNSDNNEYGDVDMENEVLQPVLKLAKEKLNSLDIILITDSVNTFGVSLAVAAAHLGLKVPRTYDLIFETKEREYMFPKMPRKIRNKIEKYMSSDVHLWHHARSLVYQRSSELIKKGNLQRDDKRVEMIPCMEYTCFLAPYKVATLGRYSMAQFSDHICEVNPSCNWAVDIPSVHKRQVHSNHG